MAESKPPSFHIHQRPPSYVDENDQNQTWYAKPPSLSDVAPTRPVSINEDQQHQQFAEKSAPTLAEVRPAQDSYQERDGTHGGVGVNAKIPSFQDVAPGKGKSEHDQGHHEESKEKLPSQSDVRTRTPNQNDSSGHRIRVNKPPSSYNGKNYEKHWMRR